MPQSQLKNSLLSFGFSPIFFIKWDSHNGGGGAEPHNIPYSQMGLIISTRMVPPHATGNNH